MPIDNSKKKKPARILIRIQSHLENVYGRQRETKIEIHCRDFYDIASVDLQVYSFGVEIDL